MMALNLELELEEVNVILKSLSKHPFEEVVNLIAKVKSQGLAQLAEQTATKESTETPAEAPTETPTAE
jgi:hypothetical protein